MNIDLLREQLAADEGCKYEIYLDHLGYPTFGIGHLVKDSDPEHGQPVGTEVTQKRVEEAFDADIKTTIQDCVNMFDEFYIIPEEAQLILANMMFNLGFPRMNKFVKMITAVYARDWDEAANQMVDSRWYRQVPNRAMRLEKRMRKLADAQEG